MTAADRVTVPVNPPSGVTVTVEVFPVVAPDAIVKGVPATLKPEATGAVTVIEAEPVEGE